MKNLLTRPLFHVALVATSVGGMLAWSGQHNALEASSHREAPLIADDPLADNTDLYAFRTPTNVANDAGASVTIIANYIPLEVPQGGPIYNTFGENIQYDIHVKNDPATPGDDFIYRFTFTKTNLDPTTFFRVRLGQENQKTTYNLDQIVGGVTTNLVTGGIVPAPNIGPRSINSAAGLNQAGGYTAYMQSTVRTLANGMRIYCGPTDDPFFTDLGAIFDLGGVRGPQTQTGNNNGTARDGLARKNIHAIAMQIPVSILSRAGVLTPTTSILDPNYIIGVWASANRRALRTINTNATQTESGAFVQVSRLGMPLTNEVITPIGSKDEWNFGQPFGVAVPAAGSQQLRFEDNLSNPELGLYMADNVPVNGAAPKPAGQTYYGEAIPGLRPLRIQSKSLAGAAGLPAGGFDFRNGAAGLSGLAGSAAVAGTALAPVASGGFGEYLLAAGKPRSVDLKPIFHTGVPNLRPYQLAIGKGGNPLAAGKPFINNFLPTFGDMLRLNMAVPPTPRNSPDFSSEGLLAAAIIAINPTNNPAYAIYNNTTLQNIPNMDGFPNGRRLEDDVTRIELQAVGGVVLAAIGLWYDDYNAAAMPAQSPVTAQLGGVVTFTTNVERNDTTFKAAFPFVQTPWSGTTAQRTVLSQRSSNLGMSLNLTAAKAFPNPFVDRTTLHFELPVKGTFSIIVSDVTGRKVATLVQDKVFGVGVNEIIWQPTRSLAPGQYIATLYSGNTVVQSVRIERN